MTNNRGELDRKQRVLLVSNSAIGPRMSGPGIRYWELARVLGAQSDLDVTLTAVPGVAIASSGSDLPVRLQSARSEADLRVLADGADVVVAPGAVVSLLPSLGQLRSPLVLDLYIPLLLEEIQRPRSEALTEQTEIIDQMRRAMVTQLLTADFYLCASEKQRDYWIGALSAAGRVNPYTHTDDPTLRRLIDVVPFGLPSHPAQHTRQVLKGIYPGIGRDDKVLLWGGGLWDWLDGVTLVQAMDRLAARRPEIKLFFMGVTHLNPQEAQRQGTRETMAICDALGLTGKTIFFNDWVPYQERANYLLEADVGISLHRAHLESRFSFRTRFLDSLWTGLPLIVTRGDVLSREVELFGLGRVVEPGDVEGVTAAIVKLLDAPNLRQEYASRFQEASERYRWERVTRPLVAFCREPSRAPDRTYLRTLTREGIGPTPWWRLPGKAWRALRLGGTHGLARQLGQYRRWWLGRRGLR